MSEIRGAVSGEMVTVLLYFLPYIVLPRVALIAVARGNLNVEPQARLLLEKG